MYILNLQKRESYDSMGAIIDAIDENFQYLNLSRTSSWTESLSN